jgi:hypothetical protein
MALFLAGCGGSMTVPPKRLVATQDAGPKYTMTFSQGSVTKRFALTLRPRAALTQSRKTMNYVLPVTGGGGCQDPSCTDPEFCPDCTWNPQVVSTSPSDLSNVNEGNGACSAFGFSYDDGLTVCYSTTQRIIWHYASFTYGQCNTGSYVYNDEAQTYKLTCTAPGGNPSDGFWWLHSTFTNLTGTSNVTEVVTATPGKEFTMSIDAIQQSAFTNLNVCFSNSPNPGSCSYSGGGISVGLR